jgi:hypothetical protein
MEDCLGGDDLNILTDRDSFRARKLLKSMQRKDFPLELYRHPVGQLLLHVVRLLNQRVEAGRATRFIARKVCAHRGEPLNDSEAADAMAAEAGECDPARSVALDQDPEAVYFLMKQAWVEWDARVREDLVQQAAEQCVTRTLQPRRGWAGEGARPPTLALTVSWQLLPDRHKAWSGPQQEGLTNTQFALEAKMHQLY